MELKGVLPNEVTYVCSLKACIIADVEEDMGLKLHSKIIVDGYEMHLLVGTTLVDVYAKCDLLAEAQDVFDELTTRNTVTWNALLSGYANHQMGEMVLEAMSKMEDQGVSPDALTYVCGLKSCGIVQTVKEGQQVYSWSVKKGLEADHKIASVVVSMFGKCGACKDATNVFNQVTERDTILWNTLLAGHIGNGLNERTLNLLKQMDSEGVPMDMDTFIHSLRACSGMGAITEGYELNMGAAKRGYDLEPLMCYCLIDMYMNCASFTDAQNVFDVTEVKDAVSWTALMAGYTDLGLVEKALDCLDGMQLKGLPLDSISNLCGLKACSTAGNLPKGRKLHAVIAEEGYEGDAYIGNSLVDLYARCGALLDAQAVLDELTLQDEASWGAFISGCTEFGYYDEAVAAMQKMQLMGISMNLVTYICRLKCSSMIGDFEMGKGVLIEILKRGLENDSFVTNSVIDMYTRFDSLWEAEYFTSKGMILDAVPWNAMIAGYAEYGLGEEALRCMERLCQEGLSPNAVTYLSCLKVCGSLEDLSSGQTIYADMVKKGVLKHYNLESALVDMYVKCDCFVEALNVFHVMQEHDVISWTALITGYAMHGCAGEASYCMRQMLAEGVYPNEVTYVSILKACSGIRDKNWGREIHSEIIIDGFEVDSFVSATLVDMYAKCGLLVEARELLIDLKVFEPTSWTALMAGYAEHGLAIDSLSVMQQIEEGGIHMSPVSYICSLKVCGSTSALSKGCELHNQLVCKGLESVPLISSSVTDMYAKCGCLDESLSIFQKMQVQDVISWNSLLAGYACQGKNNLVLAFLKRMTTRGVQPDKSTLLSVLFLCSHIGLVDEGFELIGSANDTCDVTIEHVNCHLDLLTRAGQFQEAWALMERMPFQPELVTWSTILGACQKWDERGKAVKHSFEYAAKLGRNHFLAFQQIHRTSQMGYFNGLESFL
ncbi:hypothetical protein KP509_13G044800 [Ceratopteris richardii]|nr:hypothetical protein KP509_13G044800 [Ceratopteris richardii]